MWVCRSNDITMRVYTASGDAPAGCCITGPRGSPISLDSALVSSNQIGCAITSPTLLGWQVFHLG